MNLVDTDIFIDLLRGVEKACSFFRKNQDNIIFSAITEAELVAGSKCSKYAEKEALLHFLAQFDKVPADNPLVQVAGDLRREYSIEMPDAIVAASALASNATLITRNVKDFKNVPNLKIVKPYD